MKRQPYPPPGSCVAKNSQRPASVETVQGGVPPYGVKDTLVVNGYFEALQECLFRPMNEERWVIADYVCAT